MSQSSAKIAHDTDLKNHLNALGPLNLAPLWTRYHQLLTPTPRGKAASCLWRYADVRPQLMRTGELVSTEEAERRVLMLLNPGLDGEAATTSTLFAGMQLILPGETARAHRHSPTALRIIVEGSGGYTTVDGERCTMERGDLILTPSWTWHEHGNDTTEPMIWLDGLDLPMVKALDVVFTEYPPEGERNDSKLDDVSTALYYQPGLRPVNTKQNTAYSPLLNFKWERTVAALSALPEAAVTPYDDLMMDYINPHTGGPILPTIGCTAQYIRPGIHTRAHRHANSSVYLVIDGAGYSVIDGKTFTWETGDVFAIPSWACHEHANTSQTEKAALIAFTDAPVMKSLGLYREEPHATNRGYQILV